MATLLVSCYELGHQPLGIAWPRALLGAGGGAAETMDLAVEPFDDAKVARADTIYISTPMHTARRLAVKAAERMRRINPAARVVFHGLYGEPGVFDEREMVRHVPDRRGLPPLAKYVKLSRGENVVPAGYVEASRGCLHLCRHCPIPPVFGGKFFAVPREVVMADVRQQVLAGAGHITFGDPDFLNGPTHALKLVRQLHAEFPHVSYDVTAKVEHLLEHAALLPEFAATGCAFVVSAVESLSDDVLASLEKGHTAADFRRLLELTRRAGLALRPTFVPFTPWTTLGDYLELLDFVDAEALVDHVDPVQLTIRLLVPPGSLLLARPEMTPHLMGYDEDAYSWRWKHPDPRMDALHREVSALGEAVTFEAVRALAQRAAGLDAHRPPRRRTPAPERPIPARLTEPWFC